MLNKIKLAFVDNRVLYTKHARDEMESEILGEIKELEVLEAVGNGKIINSYEKDKPYPSCLIYGRTGKNRPLHIVIAFSDSDNFAIVITVYEPDPNNWISFERRKK